MIGPLSQLSHGIYSLSSLSFNIKDSIDYSSATVYTRGISNKSWSIQKLLSVFENVGIELNSGDKRASLKLFKTSRTEKLNNN